MNFKYEVQEKLLLINLRLIDFGIRYKFCVIILIIVVTIGNESRYQKFYMLAMNIVVSNDVI